eukprot:232392_1
MVEVSNSIREIMVLIEVILCYFLTPFVIYWYIKFNKLSHSIMFQKRHPNILKFTGIITIYWFSCAMPLVSIAFAELDRFKGNIQIVLDRLNVFFYPIGTAGIFITIAWRFWHIYFDLKYSSSQKNSEWKYHLDPSLVKHNFWLTHKKDYGSSKYTKKIVIIWYFFNTLTSVITYQIVVGTDYHIIIGHALCIFLHVAVEATFVILWWKIPEYWDTFFVKQELKKLGISIVITWGVATLPFILGIIFSPQMSWPMGLWLTEIIFFVLVLVSFWWIPKKIQKVEFEMTLASSKNQVNEASVASSTTLSQQKKSNKYTLQTILSHQKAFKMFMQHLASEFSTEALLCFVEVMQFKFLMKQRFDVVDSNAITEETDFTDQYPLYEVVPLSAINRQGFKQDLTEYKGNNDPTELKSESKQICLKLFEKYIKSGAELEVNVSYKARSRLSNLMNDEAFFIGFNILPNDLFCLYDDVATQMFILMNGAFFRFKQLPIFETTIKAINNYDAVL